MREVASLAPPGNHLLCSDRDISDRLRASSDRALAAGIPGSAVAPQPRAGLAGRQPPGPGSAGLAGRPGHTGSRRRRAARHPEPDRPVGGRGTDAGAAGEPAGHCWNPRPSGSARRPRSGEHTSELPSLAYLVWRLLLLKKKKKKEEILH